jgi:hypothetical protein
MSIKVALLLHHQGAPWHNHCHSCMGSLCMCIDSCKPHITLLLYIPIKHLHGGLHHHTLIAWWQSRDASWHSI